MREFKRILYLIRLAASLEETNSYPMTGIRFLTNTFTRRSLHSYYFFIAESSYVFDH